MNQALVVSIISFVITISIFLSNVIFKTGHHAARLEALESWRSDIRKDMHEISDSLEKVNNTIEKLATLIEERTERRTFARKEP